MADDKGGSSFVKFRAKLTKTEKPVWHALSLYDVRYGTLQITNVTSTVRVLVPKSWIGG